MHHKPITATVSQILKIAMSRKQIISAAESCTGGLLAKFLSDAPGSSNTFAGAIVAYTEDSKIRTLGVDPEIIKKFGVVSEEVASLMAERALQKFASDWAISTTGYAGPTGGTAKAPLGTLCIAVSTSAGTKTQKYLLKNLSRNEHQEKSAELIFELFLDTLSKS